MSAENSHVGAQQGESPADRAEESVASRPQIPTRLSPAALNRFRSCPQRFRWQDIERRQPKQEPSPVLAQANAVHHALERFFGLAPGQRSLEILERALRHVWPQHRAGGVYASRDEEIHYGLDALELLRRFYANFDTSAVPLARESWLSLRLTNGFNLFGKIDRLDGGRGGGVVVVDYKTGKRGDLEPSDLARDPAAQVYALGAQARSGLTCEGVRLLFLRDGEEVRWEPEPDDLEEAARRLTSLVERIRGDTEFSAVPGPQCRFCPFELVCPDRSRVDLDELQVTEGLPF